MVHDQSIKTQNLEMRNLERGDSPQELEEEDARQAVGGVHPKYTMFFEGGIPD